jgi:uncharacterized protein (DUF2147 family)
VKAHTVRGVTLAFGALACASLAAAKPARAADPPSAVGFWVTQDHGGVVSIAPCDSGLCGFIVGLRTDHPPGALIADVHNPDPAKRNDPICGLALMGSLKTAKGKPNKWEDGWVYDPESGNTYKAEMQLDGPDMLKLRGYIGISLFGRTEVWKRETGEFKNRCAASAETAASGG